MQTALIVVDVPKAIVEAKKGGKFVRVELTPKERAIINYLSTAGGRVIPRAELLREIWGLEIATGVQSRTVDQHFARLRSKLGPAAAQAIVTVTCSGYKVAEGTVEMRKASDIMVRVEKVVGEYRDGKPGYAMAVWMPHAETAPKAKETLRLVRAN